MLPDHRITLDWGAWSCEDADMQIMLGASEGACFAFELDISNESHVSWISGAKVAAAEGKSVRGIQVAAWITWAGIVVRLLPRLGISAEILPTIFKHPAPAILPAPWHKFMRRGGIVLDQRS